MATIDNTTFVKPYLKKLLSDDLWRECDHCEKKDYCPILNNRGLITDRTIEFIIDNYIYKLEYGKKLTIRQIVAHLSYSLTGGLECRNVKNIDKLRFTYLLTNTFLDIRAEVQQELYCHESHWRHLCSGLRSKETAGR